MDDNTKKILTYTVVGIIGLYVVGFIIVGSKMPDIVIPQPDTKFMKELNDWKPLNYLN